jgi:hypothetical protein
MSPRAYIPSSSGTSRALIRLLVDMFDIRGRECVNLTMARYFLACVILFNVDHSLFF